MEWVASIIVAVIAGGFSLCGSMIMAKSTRNTILQQLQVQQAITNERQRVTDDKIDRLSEQLNAQAVYGTEIAVLKDQVKRLERGKE